MSVYRPLIILVVDAIVDWLLEIICPILTVRRPQNRTVSPRKLIYQDR
jgi:hypothetical protein